MTFRAITANLVLRTAVHVGTGESTETADDMLRRDGRGRLLIPGTAIAGALRSIATRLAPRFVGEKPCQALTGGQSNKACQCLVCQIFGDVNPQEDAEAGGNAARVWVYDAVLESSDVQLRDGVGIDRVTGAAARRERIKFDLEVLPAETVFKVRIEIDRRLSDERVLQLLAASLAEWEQGRGAVGGRVSRGLGAFRLDDVRFIGHDLNEAVNLMQMLRSGPPWDAADGDKSWLDIQVRALRPEITAWEDGDDTPVARSWALAEFTLAASGPFLTHDLTQAGRSGFDHAPVLATYTKNSKPVLPGSSLRGGLRSQAERIARTLTTQTASKSSDPRQHFLNHCPACNPLTSRSVDPVASCNSLIKAKLSEMSKTERDDLEQVGAENHLCLACQLFGSTWNGSRLRVEDAPFVGEKVTYKVLDFLAIDRFTGGGRDSAKFDAVVLWKPRFGVRMFLENPEPWELGWLALVLRDLNDGLATVGFGAAKGFGQCTIEEPMLTFGVLHDTDFPSPVADDENEALKLAVGARDRLLAVKSDTSGLYRTVVFDQASEADWLVLANGWVKAFNDKVLRPSPHSRANDSYFTDQGGHWLPDLYPARVS
jgi:CRISPR/Cas system CSM-associated protein Csm3 (group 7 of RAMP superfamily)